MSRLRWLVLCAAFCVPACDDDDDDPDIDLTVVNAGTASVHVDIEYYDTQDEDWKTRSFDLAAGATFTMEIFQRYADVLIVRLPDGAVMFNDVLEHDDFGGDDATITVFP